MIDHIWTVACKRAIVDADSNNVSLQSVLEQIVVNAEPLPNGVIPMPFDIMSLWIRSDVTVASQALAKISMFSPSGQEIPLKGDGDFIFTIDASNFERFRSKARFGGFPASESGQYWFYVAVQQQASDEWVRVAEIPITVLFNPPPQQSEVSE
jgi:hypothetical protein